VVVLRFTQMILVFEGMKGPWRVADAWHCGRTWSP